MSLLMFEQTEERVLIVTDTLATTPNGEPMNFQSKAWAVPHMNMAVAVTGTAEVGEEWMRRLGGHALALHVGQVANFAPQMLRQLHAELTEIHGDIGTSTVYTFGFLPDSTVPIRVIYRSTADYDAEWSADFAFAIKPQPENFTYEPPGSIPEWIHIAEQLRAENNAEGKVKPIWIGGELYLLELRSWISTTVRIHQFSDHEQMWLRMNENLARDNAL